MSSSEVSSKSSKKLSRHNSSSEDSMNDSVDSKPTFKKSNASESESDSEALFSKQKRKNFQKKTVELSSDDSEDSESDSSASISSSSDSESTSSSSSISSSNSESEDSDALFEKKEVEGVKKVALSESDSAASSKSASSSSESSSSSSSRTSSSSSSVSSEDEDELFGAKKTVDVVVKKKNIFDSDDESSQSSSSSSSKNSANSSSRSSKSSHSSASSSTSSSSISSSTDSEEMRHVTYALGLDEYVSGNLTQSEKLIVVEAREHEVEDVLEKNDDEPVFFRSSSSEQEDLNFQNAQAGKDLSQLLMQHADATERPSRMNVGMSARMSYAPTEQLFLTGGGSITTLKNDEDGNISGGVLSNAQGNEIDDEEPTSLAPQIVVDRVTADIDDGKRSENTESLSFPASPNCEASDAVFENDKETSGDNLELYTDPKGQNIIAEQAHHHTVSSSSSSSSMSSADGNDAVDNENIQITTEQHLEHQ
eukprot:GDKJ01004799.1.p1 GENE.GDKJ01004799.1~~GDKJ01004799.1.p1  ORF type:complete len:481 (+),score=187.42 GDKJ01004799.1:26-1468(+)